MAKTGTKSKKSLKSSKKSRQATDNQPKLDGKTKSYAIRCLAQFDGLTETAEKLKQEFDISITPASMHHLKSKYRKTIEKVQEQFCKNILAIPIANKAYRLQEAMKILKDADKHFRITILSEEELSGMSSKAINAIFTDNYGMSSIKLKALKQAESEMAENLSKVKVEHSGEVTTKHDVSDRVNTQIDNLIKKLGGLPNGISREDLSKSVSK